MNVINTSRFMRHPPLPLAEGVDLDAAAPSAPEAATGDNKFPENVTTKHRFPPPIKE